ncbi:50S ribosomal protein L17 [Candidatus Kaiserbacteria bacterium]|nr:50S ribosomal protein L17 [Candidatus Kaiserbacteria bacterium]
MRHHHRKRTFGRVKHVRTGLMRSLARSLVLEEGIVTTVAKAKELRPFVERLVTQAKKNTVASQRTISSRLGGAPDAVKKLHETLAPRYAARHGGYTRIVRMGQIGKQATESARIEFIK